MATKTLSLILTQTILLASYVYSLTTQSSDDLEDDHNKNTNDKKPSPILIILPSILGGIPVLICGCLITKTAIASCQKKPVTDQQKSARFMGFKRHNRNIVVKPGLKPEAAVHHTSIGTSSESVRTHSTHISADKTPQASPKISSKLQSIRPTSRVSEPRDENFNDAVVYGEDEVHLEDETAQLPRRKRKHKKKRSKAKRAFEKTTAERIADDRLQGL